MFNEKRLSTASVLRLELYLEVLERLQRDGVECVTSAEIGDTLGIAPENVRQDLSGLGAAGKPKVGYSTLHLTSIIRRIFDLERPKQACIAGFGNLGHALAGSDIWDRSGYRLAAIFDNNPALTGTEWNGLPVRSITEVFGAVRQQGVEMAVITVPAGAAQHVVDLLGTAGVRAFWNFAPVRLTEPAGAVIENQYLAWGLYTLSYRAAGARQQAG